jgi:hypothetical protein
MRIEINQDEEKLILSNEHLDNDNFVDVVFVSEENEIEITVIVEDLYYAILPFFKKQRKEL